MRVELDLSNYASKVALKTVASVDTSVYLANLKSKFDVLDIYNCSC